MNHDLFRQALRQAVRLSPEDRALYLKLTAQPDLLEQALDYMAKLPPVLHSALPTLKDNVIEQLHPDTPQQAGQLREALEQLLSERGVTLTPAEERQRYFEKWPTTSSTEEMARILLRRSYQCGWSPADLQHHFKTHRHVNIGMNVLTSDLSRPLPSSKYASTLFEGLAVLGPKNVTLQDDLNEQLVHYLLETVTAQFFPNLTELTRNLNRHGQYQLAPRAQALGEDLYQDTLNAVTSAETYAEHAQILSLIADYSLRALQLHSTVKLAKAFKQYFGEQAVDEERLYDLGYRGTPVMRLTPFDRAGYEQSVTELHRLFTDLSTRQPDDDQLRSLTDTLNSLVTTTFQDRLLRSTLNVSA